MGVYDELKNLVEVDVPTTLKSLNDTIELINGELGGEATATEIPPAGKVLAASGSAAKARVNVEMILKELEGKRKDILQEFKTSRADIITEIKTKRIEAVTEIKSKRVDALTAIGKEKGLAIQVIKGVREGALTDIANALKNAIAKITSALSTQPSGADNFNITRQPK